MTGQPPKEGELILYRTANYIVRVEVLPESDTFRLNQLQMAELLGVDVRTISEQLRNVLETNELVEEATIRRIRMVQREGRREGES